MIYWFFSHQIVRVFLLSIPGAVIAAMIDISLQDWMGIRLGHVFGTNLTMVLALALAYFTDNLLFAHRFEEYEEDDEEEEEDDDA